MPPRAEDFDTLILTIDRILDAELLLAADAASLRADAAAARQRFLEGDVDATRIYLNRLADTAAALVDVGLLESEGGTALVEAARAIARVAA